MTDHKQRLTVFYYDCYNPAELEYSQEGHYNWLLTQGLNLGLVDFREFGIREYDQPRLWDIASINVANATQQQQQQPDVIIMTARGNRERGREQKPEVLFDSGYDGIVVVLDEHPDCTPGVQYREDDDKPGVIVSVPASHLIALGYMLGALANGTENEEALVEIERQMELIAEMEESLNGESQMFYFNRYGQRIIVEGDCIFHLSPSELSERVPEEASERELVVERFNRIFQVTEDPEMIQR